MANVTKISQLPAATALNSADIMPIVQGGITKKAPMSALSALGITGPQGPQGIPGTPGQGSVGVVSPIDYGAFGDGNSHPITQTDINTHTEWIGPAIGGTTWPVGTEWDTVATQEAIYACFAVLSTPGNIVWNSNVTSNLDLNVTGGRYLINRQIYFEGEGFRIEWAARRAAVWEWTGGIVITGTFNGTNTITNVTSDMTRLYTGVSQSTHVYVSGDGIGFGTYITNISGTTITLSLAVATVGVASALATTSMFLCNSASYGQFICPSFESNELMPNDTFFGSLAGENSNVALWVLDHDSLSGGLSTQQLTIYDPYINGNTRVDTGISISPTGGGAQGDTILILNPYVSGCAEAGIGIFGANALSIQIVNGDFQGCYRYGVRVGSGSVYVNGTSFQAVTADLNNSPAKGQIQNSGADIRCGSGTGATADSDIRNVRSENSVGVINIANDPGVINYSLAVADQSARFDNYPFQVGWVAAIGPNGRSYMVADNGGPNFWHHPQSATGETLFDSSADYTVNQWVGYTLFYRFGSNGFTSHYTASITANTSTSVTTSGFGNSPSGDTLYTIGGQTASSEPIAFNSTTVNGAYYNGTASANGIFLTEGSTVGYISAAFVSAFSTATYVAIPGGMTVGFNEMQFQNKNGIPPRKTPFCFRVESITGSTIVISAPSPLTTADTTTFYYGSAITDNNIKWLEIPYNSFQNCLKLDRVVTGGGRVSAIHEIYQTSGGADYWRDGEPSGQGLAAYETVPVVQGLQLDSGTRTAILSSGEATLNTISGILTSSSLTTAASSTYVVTLTSSVIASDSRIFASVALNSATTGEPTITTIKPSTGSAVITVKNVASSTAINGTIDISYAVFR